MAHDTIAKVVRTRWSPEATEEHETRLVRTESGNRYVTRPRVGTVDGALLEEDVQATVAEMASAGYRVASVVPIASSLGIVGEDGSREAERTGDYRRSFYHHAQGYTSAVLVVGERCIRQ